MSVPEINGKPAVRISFSLAEKVGLPNYSNIDVGPCGLEKWVEDDPDAIRKGRDELIEQVEEFMAIERTKVYDFIKGKPDTK